MELLGFPRLRSLQAVRFVHGEVPYVRFVDPAGLVNPAVVVPEDMYQHVVRRFDGTRGLAEIQTRVLRETGQLLHEEKLRELIDFLDREMVLDGPTYRQAITDYRAQRLRPAALAGRSYPASEQAPPSTTRPLLRRRSRGRSPGSSRARPGSGQRCRTDNPRRR